MTKLSKVLVKTVQKVNTVKTLQWPLAAHVLRDTTVLLQAFTRGLALLVRME
jgi:hypothetical protein